MALMRLPGYDTGSPLLNLNPLNQAIQFGAQQQQRGFENDRALKREKMAQEQFDMSKQDRMIKQAGNLALAVINDPDPARGQANFQKFLSMVPGAAEDLAKNGLDAKDYMTAARAIAAKAGVLPDPLDQRIKTAQAASAEGGLAMQPLQRESMQLDIQGKRKALEEPKIGTADIGPDHARIFYDPRTGEEKGRLQGPAKGPDSTARKAIFEAQDELPNLKAAVDQLKEANELLPQIYSGFGSGVRTTWNQGTPSVLPNIISNPDRAQATQRYDQIMGAEAIGQMSQTLKGATTNEEMRAFVKLINDPNTAIEVKKKAMAVMIRKAEAHYRNRIDRIKELGGRMPNDGTGVPGTAPSGGAADPLGIR